jgi:hypothetical protein
VDQQIIDLHTKLTEGIELLTGYKLHHTSGKGGMEHTYFLHCGRTCVATLQFQENNCILTIYMPEHYQEKAVDKTTKYDYADPESFDPEKIGKLIRDSIIRLEKEGLIEDGSKLDAQR